MSSVALRRVRFRVRRRRPPSAREVIHALLVGGFLSQAGWLAVHALRGDWFDGLMLLAYPPGLWVLHGVRERQRYWERHGLALPVGWEDWVLPAGLWVVQVALWGGAL